jgi:hypothetical protein
MHWLPHHKVLPAMISCSQLTAEPDFPKNTNHHRQENQQVWIIKWPVSSKGHSSEMAIVSFIQVLRG